MASSQTKELGEYLKCLKNERGKLEKALQDEAQKIPALAKKLDRKDPKLKRKATPKGKDRLDPQKLAQLRAATPEQQKIKAIRKRRDDAKTEIEELRGKVLLRIRRLAVRSPEAENVRHQIQGLPPYSHLSNADTIIELLDELLATVQASETKGPQRTETDKKPDPPKPPDWWRNKTTLTVAEAAEVLGYTERYIYDLVAEGKLTKLVMTGKSRSAVRIKKESIETMLETKKV